ncbi:hypothetical protein [Nostocoides sp. HKS02]|uniref:hypothetical protein n=1 Tax=Nostocoides sp. HKS02 TaxID=1813880 RepID=UPI0012B44B69|nr:hypothetical protein [Tetrasphaera sp. HKS02]QGN57148.1 hypothetical protein GKE56_03795 [Tetrasphaera sp. HKS02]
MSETYEDTGTRSDGDVTGVAKDEARATAEQAKEGAGRVAAVGKDEAMHVAQEAGQQAKDLWNQTRSQLLDQSAEQQSRVAEGLRSLSQELSTMARGSQQQGVASDLAQQASQRVGEVAGWLDERDPGSLVAEVKRFARQRPGAFLGAAAVLGLVGGRLSRGLVADHQETGSSEGATASTGNATGNASTGYAAPAAAAAGSPTDTWVPAAERPVLDPMTGTGGTGAVSTGATGAGEYPR